jgi:hypothetical protein
MANKNILLIEPGYKNKYPPLGLMKIAQYHGVRGKKDNITFIKGEDKKAMGQPWDRIYITSLFSFEWNNIARSIDFAIEIMNGDTSRIFVGGIAASLMHEKFVAQNKWGGVRFIKGLLDKAPAISLALDDFEEELYSDDVGGTPIEDLTPDYDILHQIDYEYPVHDAYFVYASRGCIRKCHFCGVPKLEGAMRDTYSVTRIVNEIEELYGPKKDLIFMDNNVVASARFKEIMAEIRELGFTPGAKLKRGNSTYKRRVDFNQGVDARILCKDPMFLRELSTICIKPLRIAFDHLGVKKPYEQAIRYSAEHGLTDLSNYMLYNFHDTPTDLFERMRLNVTLNEELNIRIFSFPMRYQPTDLPHRTHVGNNWNKHFLRSMQIILQATHGIVSGSPQFFKLAFGNTAEEYVNLLYRPHHFIFNRFWYEHGDGRSDLDNYKKQFNELSSDEKQELIEYLSNHPPREIGVKDLDELSQSNKNIIHHYKRLDKTFEQSIWASQKERSKEIVSEKFNVPLDELVEDAGLELAN